MLIVYIWKRLFYDGKYWDYLINQFGDIMNFDNKVIRWRYISSGRGYHVIDLYDENGKHTLLVHRLVASTFIPNPENKPTVNHINGNKEDNSDRNLEWATYSENNQHAYDTKLKVPKCGVDSIFTKYAESDIVKICERLEKGLSVRKISKELNLPISLIASIKSGLSWKSISDKYKIVKPRFYMDELTKNKILYLYANGNTISDILTALNWPNTGKYRKRIRRALGLYT